MSVGLLPGKALLAGPFLWSVSDLALIHLDILVLIDTIIKMCVLSRLQ